MFFLLRKSYYSLSFLLVFFLVNTVSANDKGKLLVNSKADKEVIEKSLQFGDWVIRCVSQKLDVKAVPAKPSVKKEGQSLDAKKGSKASSSNKLSKLKSCRMVQQHALEKNGKALFIFSIVPRSENFSVSSSKNLKTKKKKVGSAKGSSAKSGYFGIITVPSQVYLAPAILMQVDKKRSFKILYEICNEAGCHGGFKMSKQVLRAFRKGETAVVRFWTAANQALDVKVSLKGFVKAYDALTKESV